MNGGVGPAASTAFTWSASTASLTTSGTRLIPNRRGVSARVSAINDAISRGECLYRPSIPPAPALATAEASAGAATPPIPAWKSGVDKPNKCSIAPAALLMLNLPPRSGSRDLRRDTGRVAIITVEQRLQPAFEPERHAAAEGVLAAS